MNKSTPKDFKLIELALTEQSSHLFPEVSNDDFSIEWIQSSDRVFSTLHEFSIDGGPTTLACMLKVTKTATQLPQHYLNAPSEDGIVSFLPDADPIGSEYSALQKIHGHFELLNDVRFAPLRVRGELFDRQAFVMEKASAASLSNILRKNIFAAGRLQKLVPIFLNAGSWLSEFHAMASPTKNASEHDSAGHHEPCERWRSNLESEFGSAVEFLNKRNCDLGNTPAYTVELANQLGESDFETGLHHHDFAPRNILINQESAITVIDTVAEEIRPRLEDLAHFIVDFRTCKLQLISQGWAYREKIHHKLEQALMQGYFGSTPIPWRALRLFEARQLLIHWVTSIWERENGPPESMRQRFFVNARIKVIRKRLQQICTMVESQNFCPLSHKEERVQGHDSAEDRLQARIIEKLESNSSQYYSGTFDCQPTVTLLDRIENKYSSILICQCRHKDVIKNLVVKIARNPLFDRPSSTTFSDRPRLTNSLLPGEELPLEFSTLQEISRRFDEDNHPGLGAVKVFDYLESESALVMEHLDFPTLTELIERLESSKHSAADMETIGTNVGRWLKTFHSFSTDHEQARDVTAAEVIDNFKTFGSFIEDRIGDHRWFAQIVPRIERLISLCFPDPMPSGLGHGDFAPQNLLIGPNFEVTGIDTLGRWRKPVFEDIAHFLYVLTDLGSPKNQSSIQTLEQHFLKGYFGSNPVAANEIKLFSALILFDKWSSQVFSHSRASGLKKHAKTLRLKLRNKQMKQRLEKIVADLEIVLTPNSVADSHNSTNAFEGGKYVNINV